MKDIDFHFHQQYILSKQVDKSIGDIKQEITGLISVRNLQLYWPESG